MHLRAKLWVAQFVGDHRLHPRVEHLQAVYLSIRLPKTRIISLKRTKPVLGHRGVCSRHANREGAGALRMDHTHLRPGIGNTRAATRKPFGRKRTILDSDGVRSAERKPMNCRSSESRRSSAGSTDPRRRSFDSTDARESEAAGGSTPAADCGDISYVLASNRLVDGMTAIYYVGGRDGFRDPDQLGAALGSWVTRYVLLDDEASYYQQREYPLRAATIEIDVDKRNAGVHGPSGYLSRLQLPRLEGDMPITMRLRRPSPATTATLTASREEYDAAQVE